MWAWWGSCSSLGMWFENWPSLSCIWCCRPASQRPPRWDIFLVYLFSRFWLHLVSRRVLRWFAWLWVRRREFRMLRFDCRSSILSSGTCNFFWWLIDFCACIQICPSHFKEINRKNGAIEVLSFRGIPESGCHCGLGSSSSQLLRRWVPQSWRGKCYSLQVPWCFASYCTMLILDQNLLSNVRCLMSKAFWGSCKFRYALPNVGRHTCAHSSCKEMQCHRVWKDTYSASVTSAWEFYICCCLV